MTEPVQILVLTQSPMPEALLAEVRAVSPRVQLTHRTAVRLEDLGPVWDEVEVLYTSGLLPAPEQAPRLRWVQGHFAGVDHLIAHPLLRPGARTVTLTTAAGVHVPNMAEYALLLMLAFGHRLPQLAENQARRHWPEARWTLFTPAELRGATVGVIGYGAIGREIARLAKAFGMRVLAARRDPDAPLAGRDWELPGTGDPDGRCVERFYALSDLASLLPECDYVVLIVPLTEQTRHLIDAAALKRMKPSAVLVNVARGAVVDEAALIEALRAGQIGGAALDVFEREPLPADSPLWSLPNVLLSPHVGGFTPHYDRRAMTLFADNLRRYLAGQPLLNVVDVARGY